MSKRFTVVFLLIVSIFTIRISYAQNTRSQENKRTKLLQEIALIDKQLQLNESKSKSALSDLNLIRKKISNRNELITESDKEINALNVEISKKTEDIQAIQSRLDTLSAYYAKLVRNAYKNRDAKIWYMYILASDNLGQGFRRVGYLRNLSSQMNVQATKIRETQKELEVEKDKLSDLKKAAQSVKNQRVNELNSLKSEEGQSQLLIDKLKKDSRQYKKDLNTKRKQVEALNREIERILAEAAREAERAKKGDKKSGKNTDSRPKIAIDYTLDKEFTNNKGKLPWPVDGPVVEQFGQHYHPVFTKVLLPFNNGITIATSPGAKAKAVFNGVVKQIVVMPGYNVCVLVQHGNYFSFYCKLDKANVKAGDKVKTGDVLGTVGTIDNENQLHFQIWNGTKPQNPELWLR